MRKRRRYASREIEAEFEKLVRIFRKVAMDDYSEKPEIPDDAIAEADPLTQVSVALRFMIDDLERARAEREEAYKLLHQEQARLISSINGLALGLLIFDDTGKVLMANGVAQRIFDTKQVEFDTVAKWLGEAIDFNAQYAKVLASNKSIDKREMYILDRYYHVYIAPVAMAGATHPIGATLLIEDITEAKMTERSKDEFFSIASHELRTPLTTIRGNTAMVLAYYQDVFKGQSELRSVMNDIHDSSVRLIDIVNDFLSVSRLEQGRMQFNPVKFNLREVVEKTAKSMQVVADEKGISLRVVGSKQRATPVYADTERVEQILYNLVGNAVKFTDKGGVKIRLELEEKHALVCIEDTGRGVSPESQHLLFRKFQQANNNIWTRDTAKGTGLGLYISKLMAEKMGGTVRLDHSEENVGSVFVLTLPLARN